MGIGIGSQTIVEKATYLPDQSAPEECQFESYTRTSKLLKIIIIASAITFIIPLAAFIYLNHISKKMEKLYNTQVKTLGLDLKRSFELSINSNKFTGYNKDTKTLTTSEQFIELLKRKGMRVTEEKEILNGHFENLSNELAIELSKQISDYLKDQGLSNTERYHILTNANQAGAALITQAYFRQHLAVNGAKSKFININTNKKELIFWFVNPELMQLTDNNEFVFKEGRPVNLSENLSITDTLTYDAFTNTYSIIRDVS